ncbi:hypothetical protein WR25_08043 [Diploscapter pachys]|uniref:Uncharacterized protein n=1 Tax=Diploscapter pachys TaxID=2018661 RepID=A0A2A2JE79_9BILA|nr:hypothetical protein WR25_08043 [Diploscapter pachys]
MIAVGLMKIGECPDQTALPHWMYHFGILILLSMIVKFVWQKFGDKSLRKTNAKILVSLRVIFGIILIMTYFYGLYLMLWVFFMKDPACDLFLQLFALLMLILTGLIATLGCCFVCCGVGLKNVEKTDFFQNAILHTGIQESDFLLPKQVIGNLLQ